MGGGLLGRPGIHRLKMKFSNPKCLQFLDLKLSRIFPFKARLCTMSCVLSYGSITLIAGDILS